ncbi:hypothetical protein [Alkanindiges illinoisensis]|uniref:hypothetical protein n=1 Tax=Alkanindiges illinoisensis TaxID=197183 RepID=UPI00047D3B7F|nr:hypothetical protein [Alkanindiges illinoisensis]
MIIDLLVRANPNVMFSIDGDPAYLEDELYIQQITSGYEKLWQELKLPKFMHVALKKTFEHPTNMVYLYDLEHKSKLDEIGFYEIAKVH